eukprot:5678834-Amphidinium_carterae.1
MAIVACAEMVQLERHHGPAFHSIGYSGWYPHLASTAYDTSSQSKTTVRSKSICQNLSKTCVDHRFYQDVDVSKPTVNVFVLCTVGGAVQQRE